MGESPMEAQVRTASGFVTLELPKDHELLIAAGRVALRHGQLEYMLRLVVKTLAGLTINEAMDATREHKNWEVRDEIKKLISQKTKDRSLILKARALLGESGRLSDRRNELLHKPWAIGEDGTVVVKSADHAWVHGTSTKDLNGLADQILELVVKLNHARLHGFIHEICAASEETKPAKTKK